MRQGVGNPKTGQGLPPDLIAARYIKSLNPVFYVDLARKDAGMVSGSRIMLSDDAYKHPITASGVARRQDNYYHDGIDDILSFPGVPILNLPGPVTWMAWARWDTIVNARNQMYHLCTGKLNAAANTEGGIGFFMGSDRKVGARVMFGNYTAVTSYSDMAIDTYMYHFFVSIYDRKNVYLYIDNQLQSDIKVCTNPIPATTQTARIGSSTWDDPTWTPFHGNSGKIGIFEGALMSQMRTVYELTKWRYQ